MTIPKSHTEFILGLYNVLLTQDMVRHYGFSKLFERDYAKLRSRVRHEGISYLTKTLPLLGKALDNALLDGVFTCPTNFKTVRGTAYPCFLQGLLKLVFRSDGSILPEPDVSAVRDIRQICYLYYKYELPYKKEVIDEFLINFQETDRDCGTGDSIVTSGTQSGQILGVARTLLSDLLQGWTSEDIVPSHGPGAVASGEKQWEKMTFGVHYDTLHQRFPYYKYFCSNVMDLAHNIKEYKNRKRAQDGCAKVVLVPKDSRGPRLISMEPLEFQWIQQGVRRKLYDWIERHPLTRGQVNFRDQSINGRLALLGSVSSGIVTLDMKEASDRISLQLVSTLFADTSLLPDLLATRTKTTELTDGTQVRLNKYAPMGSALCFPIMSLVHWSLAVASLNVCSGVSLKQARKAVFVYGDDIVVKGQNHEPLLNTFPSFGLKFNERKCCTSGIFRESCGTDAMLGENVTPLKLRKMLPTGPYDAVGYASYITYVNRLWEDAYYSSSLYMGDYIVRIFGTIPHVHPSSDVPGFTCDRTARPNASKFRRRWNKALQRFEWKVKGTRSPELSVELGRCEYHRKLVTHSEEFLAGVYTVPHRVKLTTRWSPSLISEGDGGA